MSQSEYQKEFGRSPKRSEWERLLHEAVQPVEQLTSSSKEFVTEEQAVPEAVKLILGGKG